MIFFSKNKVDNHITNEEFDQYVQKNAADLIKNMEIDQTLDFMKNIGWIEQDHLYNSNGDVDAYAFKKYSI